MFNWNKGKDWEKDRFLQVVVSIQLGTSVREIVKMHNKLLTKVNIDEIDGIPLQVIQKAVLHNYRDTLMLTKISKSTFPEVYDLRQSSYKLYTDTEGLKKLQKCKHLSVHEYDVTDRVLPCLPILRYGEHGTRAFKRMQRSYECENCENTMHMNMAGICGWCDEEDSGDFLERVLTLAESFENGTYDEIQSRGVSPKGDPDKEKGHTDPY